MNSEFLQKQDESLLSIQLVTCSHVLRHFGRTSGQSDVGSGGRFEVRVVDLVVTGLSDVLWPVTVGTSVVDVVVEEVSGTEDEYDEGVEEESYDDKETADTYDDTVAELSYDGTADELSYEDDFGEEDSEGLYDCGCRVDGGAG
jgi:hypothetical protein